jgi:acyl-CoA synthetase (NDP forming)
MSLLKDIFGKEESKAKAVAIKKQKSVSKPISKSKSTKPKKAERPPKRTEKVKKTMAKPAAKPEKVPEISKIPDQKAYEILKKYKIPVVKQAFVKNEKQLSEALKKINFPVVMKVSGAIIHKTEVGGIIKNINSEAEAREAFAKLMKIKGCESVLVQEQIDGIELIVGAKNTAEFGNVVSVGIGGIFVEIMKDVAFRVCPLTKEDVHSMLMELKGREILLGARGKKAVNLEALINTILSVGRLVENEEISEMDINPLMCNENGCFAVDVRIIKNK